MAPLKVHKQGVNENPRRLPYIYTYYRWIVVKTTRRLLYNSGTDAHEVQSSSLSLPWSFCSRVVFLCFHQCLVSVLFKGLSLLVEHFKRKKCLHLDYVSFFLTWQQTYCSVPVHAYSLSLSSNTVVVLINFNISVHVFIAFTAIGKTQQCK